MNRKYDFDRLSRMLNLRLNEPENLEFKRFAERQGTNRTRLLRKIVRELIGEGPDLLPPELKVMEELAYQLAALGRNLNQLVRVCHSDPTSRISVDRSLLETVEARTLNAKELVNAMIERSRRRWVKHEAKA